MPTRCKGARWPTGLVDVDDDPAEPVGYDLPGLCIERVG